jgi:tetratricopeptide (TPR) repeat protein
MKKRFIVELFLLVTIFVLSGCIQWNPKYVQTDLTSSKTDILRLMNKANALAKKADTAEKLKKAISAYENVLDADPSNYDSLSYLSTFNLLMGDGYTKKRSEKIKYFRSAMNYSAQAMYTNPDFKTEIDKGVRLWEALHTLSVHEMEAMFFWTTGIFYYYKEALNPLAQVIDYRWVKRAKLVMERMMDLDPDWGGGGVYFIWGIYYLSIPESVGGDRKLSEDYFEKAVAAGPDWMMSRWGRAKYFHFKMGHKVQFQNDLEWILDQDIKKYKDHFAWKVFFQKDAEYMLSKLDEYFLGR